MFENLKNFYVTYTDWLGERLAKYLSTMGCFYLIALLVIIPLFFQQPTGIGWIQYIVTVFFQGVALPLLGYVAAKSGEKTEKTIKETHDIVMDELTLINEELKLAKEERIKLNKIIVELTKSIN